MVSVIPTRVLGPRFELLDYVRFAAAFAVLAYHWVGKVIETGPLAEFTSYGYLGVHLFFMVSGFVIAISARGRAASQFAVRRAVRLYPAFWVAMLTTATVTALWGAPQFHVTPVEVLANLTMAPNVFDQPLVDGVYWTLLNELIFYGMIFLFLVLRLDKWLDTFFPAWAIGMIAVLHLAPQFSTTPLLGGLYSFFAGGAIISTVHRNGWSLWQGVGLLSSFYVAIRYTIDEVARLNAENGPFTQSTLATCVIVGSFYLLLLAQIHPRVTSWQLPQSVLLGALTYPLYLLHAHLGYIFFAHFANDDNRWWMLALALVLVLVMSYLLHVIVEKRLKKFWSKMFERAIGSPIERLERAVYGVGKRGAVMKRKPVDSP